MGGSTPAVNQAEQAMRVRNLVLAIGLLGCRFMFVGEISRDPVVSLLLDVPMDVEDIFIQSPGSMASSRILFDGNPSQNIPKLSQTVPSPLVIKHGWKIHLLLGFLNHGTSGVPPMAGPRASRESGSPRPLDASRQEKTNLHLVDVQQFL